MLNYQFSNLCLIVKILISYIYFNISFAEFKSKGIIVSNNSVKTLNTYAIELGFNDFEQQFIDFKVSEDFFN